MDRFSLTIVKSSLQISHTILYIFPGCFSNTLNSIILRQTREMSSMGAFPSLNSYFILLIDIPPSLLRQSSFRESSIVWEEIIKNWRNHNQLSGGNISKVSQSKPI